MESSTTIALILLFIIGAMFYLIEKKIKEIQKEECKWKYQENSLISLKK